jgi:hypothetical protein
VALPESQFGFDEIAAAVMVEALCGHTSSGLEGVCKG